MGKIVGLTGALAAFGAVAYLTAPLPPSSTASAPPSTSSAFAAAPVAAAPQMPLHVASAGSASSEPQQTLVHQIQAELRQLGCYNGAVDGQWSEATQQAMRTLGERASVLRPVDTPDYIMLALARSQPSDICAERPDRPVTSRTAALVTTSASSAPQQAGEAFTARAVRGSPTRPTSVEKVASNAPQPWHITVQRAAPAPSRQAAQGKLPEATIAPTNLAVLPARTPNFADQPSLENPRMGLGAVDVDPLRAGRDPRNPSATALLHGAPLATPTDIDPVAGAPTLVEAAPPARPIVHAPVASERYLPLHRQSRRAFQRNVFTEMSRNGP